MPHAWAAAAAAAVAAAVDHPALAAAAAAAAEAEAAAPREGMLHWRLWEDMAGQGPPCPRPDPPKNQIHFAAKMSLGLLPGQLLWPDNPAKGPR